MSDDHASSDETKLNLSTVGRLRTDWIFTTSGDVPNIPTVEGNAVYTTDNGGSVWRVDARTGKAVWHVNIAALTNSSQNFSRTSPAIGPNVVIVGDQQYGVVYALRKTDGRIVWATRLSTAQHALITASPVILGNRVYLGVSSMQEELASTQKGFKPDFRGSAVALDLSDGHAVWQTYTVPVGYTGGAVWGSNIAIDTKRNTLFATTGDNYSVPPDVAQCQLSASDPPGRTSCLSPNDHIDSVLAFDLATGRLKWSRRMTKGDTWTVSCLPGPTPPATPCPKPAGKDYDFSSAANLFSVQDGDRREDLVGAGQKSGMYWALDRDTGRIVWMTQVNPGGTRGGIEWGSATDGTRIYVAASNSLFVESTLRNGFHTDGGWWSALDAATGRILWQTATLAKQPPLTQAVRGKAPPPGARARTEGALTTANGIVYGGDTYGNFVAINGKTGHILWHFATGGSVIGAPAIVDGSLYWGDGYADVGVGASKLYKLSVQDKP